MKRVLCGMTMFAAIAMLIASSAVSQPPGKKDDDAKGREKGPPRFELGQIFPPPLLEELELTPEQEKELDAISKNLKQKLERMLTVEQMKKIENFRPRGPGRKGNSFEKDKEKDKDKKKGKDKEKDKDN
jgi:hypothetical protein